MLSKYVVIIRTTWQRALTYRFTVFAFRIGEILEIVALVLMWSAIFRDQVIIRGFTLPEMVTYILFGNLVHVLTRNFITEIVARDIAEGTLSVFLTRPISYLRYIITHEIGRIGLAFFLSIISQMGVILFFNEYLIVRFSWPVFILLIAMVFLVFITEMLIGFSIGLISFWTIEVRGLHLTLERLRKFFSGGYFPLALLPSSFQLASLFLPFAYTFYIPAQIYLGKIPLVVGWYGLAILALWIVLLYAIIRLVWKRGLSRYEAIGI